jgi:Flp pilus assembly protein TadD
VVRGGDFETLLARGNQAYKARKYAEATAHFRKATEVNPRNPVGHHKLGDSLMQTGKLDDAAQAYQQAIDLTGYAPAFMGMARVLERKGQIAKAISTLEAAMEQHPGHTGIQRLLDSLKGR